MSPPVNGNRPVSSRRGLRLAALIAAGVCVLAIAAGAFAFSYPGVRDTALTAGVSPRLARFYPLLFDAVLIVACAAAVTLRGVLRAYAWLAVLVVIGAIATADTVHALSITVPKRPLQVTIAIAPWVVLLTGLSLLDAMIRRTPSRKAGAVGPVSANGRMPVAGSPDSTAEQPADAVVVPLSALLHESPTAPAGQTQAADGQPTADASPAWVTITQPAARGGQPEATAGTPQTTASPAQATVSPAQATASPAQTAADPPPTTADPRQTTADPPSTTADPRQTAADPPSTTADPAEAGPADPVIVGSPAPVSQASQAPQPPEQDAPGDTQAGSADPVRHFDRMRSTPTPPDG
jgi:Protein of unknown function (DUF2637)